MFKGKNSYPPLIRGKQADTNAGFQENISREKQLGESMKQSEAVAYGEARDSYRRNKKKSPMGRRP